MDKTTRALRDQLGAVGAELLAARHEGDALRAQLAAVGAELAAARDENTLLTRQATGGLGDAAAPFQGENDALKAQLTAVGEELATARADNKALHEQLIAVGAELAESRIQLGAAEGQIARMVPVDPDHVLTGDEGETPGTRLKAYVAAIRGLEDQLEARPEDAALRIRLARGYLLQSMGGPPSFDYLRALTDVAFDPDAALAVLGDAPAENDSHRALRRAARRLATPAIVIAALPKSASIFLAAALRDGLGKPNGGPAAGGQFPEQVVVRGIFDHALRLRAVVHSHLSASRMNLIELFEHYRVGGVVVQVRDPRQALVSWFHFMPGAIAHEDPSLARHWQVPPEYASWTPERQLDWCLAGWYRVEIEWLMGWLEAAAQPALRERILLTRFEDMVTDQPAYFARILDFYGIAAELFDLPEQPKALGEHNFRLGRIDEWRETLTPGQIERASAAIPDALYERFGWARH